jgi:drug/metabolite transporter (DMT)-like permease
VRRSFGVVLVAFAACLWGLDQWIRGPLSATTTAGTIVFGEHLVLVVLTLPLAAGALTAVLKLGWRYVFAAIAIGAGGSAVATILYTQALFAHHDFVTPAVLQKSQPVFAVLGAVVVLGERPRPRYAAYFAVALAGTWLMGIRHPLHPEAHGLVTMLYALGAAALWGLGTVFGRYLTRELRFEHVTTLRFLFGLAASAIALLVLGVPAFASWHDTFWIGVLALVTGFAAMFLYYYGLRSTPAVAATIAELAFPVTTILVGYFKFGQSLTGWQWVGVGITSAVVAVLPARPRDAGVPMPAPAPA